LPSSFAEGRYRVEGFLGEGGRKRVYVAHDHKLDRQVAVAVIKTEGLDADGLTRVRREAQAMARLGNHPNIVTVFDIGEEPGADGRAQPYIISQFMDGGDLSSLLLRQADGHRMAALEAISIAAQVCDGLQHAHGNGIIHRDLKPANVWLSADGGVRLGDFGLAVSLDRSRLTIEGMVVGTVAYMAPEQALGRPPDVRCDLYSLGCMLYQMITGSPPFPGDDAVAVISQHINTPPVAPSWHNPEVPPALETLVMRLLEKDPEKRPASAAEAASLLRSFPAESPGASPAAPQALAAQSPVYRRTFIGRESELKRLEDAFESAHSGRGALVMVVGEPGIGKTSLCEQLATFAAVRGGRTLVGHCYEEGSLSMAYLPFIEAMRSYVLSRDREDLLRELGSGAVEIARIVSEVRDQVEVDQLPPVSPQEERYRLFQAVTGFLKNAAAAQPLVIVLEDLHDADRGTLDLLLHVSRHLAESRLVIIGTYRDIEVDRAHPLSSALAELRRHSQYARIALRGLTTDEVQRMLSAIAGQEIVWSLAEVVHRQTEGNPLFVQEVMRYLAEEGLVAREGGQWRSTTEQLELAIPEGLRDVIGKRMSRLSEDCNRLLAMAAVIGREFPLRVLTALTDMPEDGLISAVEEAVRVGVLEDRTRGSDIRYRFTHAFFRQSLYEELIAPRRIRFHQQIARALETQYADRLEEHATELADHFSYSSDPADLAKAVGYGEMAAARASGVFAHSEAASLLQRALDVQEVLDPHDRAKRCDLLLAQFLPRHLAGDVDGARPLLFEAAEIARQLSDRKRLVAAAVASMYIIGIMGVDDDDLVALQEDGLRAAEEENDPAARVRLMSLIGRQLASTDRAEEGTRMINQAVELARDQQDAAALLVAVTSIGFGVPLRPALLDKRLLWAQEIEDLTAASGAVETAFIPSLIRCLVALTRGDMNEFRRQYAQQGEIADRYHIALDVNAHALLTAEMHRISGEYDAAEEILREQKETPLLNWNLLMPIRSAGGTELLLRAERGTLDEIAGERAAARAALAGSRYLTTRVAHEDALLSERQDCRVAFDDVVAHRLDGLDLDPFSGYVAAALCEACLFLEDAGRAAPIYDAVRDFAGHCLVLRVRTPVWFGPADRYLGGLAALMGRWDDAEGHYQVALALTERMPAPPMHARTQHDYAGMLLRRDGPGDREHALSLLAAAGETAQRIGMRVLLDQVMGLKLEAQGVDAKDVLSSISSVASDAAHEKTDLSPHAAPDGTITIMFTDIEDSTLLTDRMGDKRWVAVLREHNRLVREQLALHGGHEVKNRGDGFMVVFRDPANALRCALAIQDALGRSDGGDDSAVRVRIGLHCGTAVSESGDFYGREVNFAARIADQAAGGEIVASAAIKAQLDAGNVEFGSARLVALKGFSGTHEIWAVEWA
jgi:class 3 adenylate cyclase/tetratricopeptide (TPR) repeat protein